jgi:Fe2+ or Zn2+ uptake regulation protein
MGERAVQRDWQIGLGLLERLRLAGESDQMHMNSEKPSHTGDRVHLACFQCGRIEEFSSPLFKRLKAGISRQIAFEIRITRCEVGGVCRECRGWCAPERARAAKQGRKMT